LGVSKGVLQRHLSATVRHPCCVLRVSLVRLRSAQLKTCPADHQDSVVASNRQRRCQQLVDVQLQTTTTMQAAWQMKLVVHQLRLLVVLRVCVALPIFRVLKFT
jgi:hypothetical protein